MSAGREARASVLGRIAAGPVRFYRAFLSPLKPPTCRFHPTCSAYAEEALRLHGLWRGSRLAAWRILRCQPFCKGGLDPVPGSPMQRDLAAGERAVLACAERGDVDTPPSPSTPGAAPTLPPGPPR